MLYPVPCPQCPQYTFIFSAKGASPSLAHRNNFVNFAIIISRKEQCG